MRSSSLHTTSGAIEYWAAATVREKAVAAVEKELPPGWTARLTYA
jgi:hypothetical protein